MSQDHCFVSVLFPDRTFFFFLFFHLFASLLFFFPFLPSFHFDYLRSMGLAERGEGKRWRRCIEAFTLDVRINTASNKKEKKREEGKR